MSGYFDISLPIENGMVVWPGDPQVRIEENSTIENGDASNTTFIYITTHTGTHIDAPKHFIEDGNGIDVIDLNVLAGTATVVALHGIRNIDRRSLENAGVAKSTRLLLKTDNSKRYSSGFFETDFTALTLDGAEYLIDLGTKLIGIDYYSIEAFRSLDYPVHKALLGAGIIILECINLEQISPGDYDLICLPLRIKNGDGAPVRAILRELA